MRRNFLPLFFLFCILGLMAFSAWLTRHPDAEIVRRAEEWPVVGPWAVGFRERYAPPVPIEPTVNEGAGALSDRQSSQRISNPRPSHDSSDLVWLLRGSILRRGPSADAKQVRRIDEVTTAVKLERRGDWFHVRHSGERVWVYLEGYDESGGPPYGDSPEPTKALQPRPPDTASLAACRELLGDREKIRQLGPYRAYTDVDDEALLDRLDRLATQVETVYSTRYGLEPLGSPAAAVVLYRSELPYRVLEKSFPRLAGLHSAGHASRGLAVLYTGERSRADVATTLVHELTHFLNRRALGPALPPWIDEGLADGVATSRIHEDGRLAPEAVGGSRQRHATRIVLDGALASLYRLQGAILDDTLPSIEALTRLDWDGFVRSERRQMHYDASAFWIRYLLDGGNPRLAEGLRRFLAGVAVGEPATPEILQIHLGRDWATLDDGFRRWVESHPALPPEAFSSD